MPLATAVHGRLPQEADMIERMLFMHYRWIRNAITTLVALGLVLLLGQLILWVRF
jgi:hypothetical protein